MGRFPLRYLFERIFILTELEALNHQPSSDDALNHQPSNSCLNVPLTSLNFQKMVLRLVFQGLSSGIRLSSLRICLRGRYFRVVGPYLRYVGGSKKTNLRSLPSTQSIWRFAAQLDCVSLLSEPDWTTGLHPTRLWVAVNPVGGGEVTRLLQHNRQNST